MINLILVLLLVHFLIPLIKGKRSTVLGCGLLGFSGEYPADKNKLAVLFMYNEKRGEHSAGYYTHKTNIKPELRITKKGNKVSEHLLTDGDLVTSKLFIGHTRHATSGVGTTMAENAHPFLFGKWVGAHNGTLKNIKGLLREYDLDEKEIDIDSKIFPASMNKNNNFKVLSHYEGAAALLWTNVKVRKEPVLYAYHDNERPLYRGTIKEGGKVGMYMSSIKDSLLAINCTDVEAFTVNTLYMIKDGIIESELKISRSKIIPNEIKRLPQSFKMKCRKQKGCLYEPATSTNARRETITYDDGTMDVRYTDYLLEKILLNEEVTYDPIREITVHTKYFKCGGFEEIKISEKRTTTSSDDNTIAVEDVFNYITELYSTIDDTRAKLSDALDKHGVTDSDLEGLDDVMVNISSFVGVLADVEEDKD